MCVCVCACVHTYVCMYIYIYIYIYMYGSRVSSGSIVFDYGLDNRAIGVRSPAWAKDFYSILCVQTGSEAHPASCTMGTGIPFQRDADHSPPPSAEVPQSAFMTCSETALAYFYLYEILISTFLFCDNKQALVFRKLSFHGHPSFLNISCPSVFIAIRNCI
jgi:hypothetical protein